MKLLSVNVGKTQLLNVDGEVRKTGIFKNPVSSAEITAYGLATDSIVNTRYHGGVDQAVYVYSAEDYAFWSERLGKDLSYGTFGENLTLSHFEQPVHIGDRYQVGEVLLEVTAPRIPCNIFEARMAQPHFEQDFAREGRTGFYARVVRTGTVFSGDAVEVTLAEHYPTLNDIFTLMHTPKAQRAARDIQQALASPLAERYRKQLI